MMPMLRFFRHGDGNFAQFNGMGPTPVDLLATVLAYDDARGAPVANAPHSGYQRIDAGDTALIDGHRPAAAGRAQPGGACRLPVVRIVVAAQPRWWSIAACRRSTGRTGGRSRARPPAHSTVTFNDTSSCRFLETGSFRKLLFGVPIVGGPHRVERRARGHRGRRNGCAPAHDGYAPDFGVIHRRALRLCGRRPPARRRGQFHARPRGEALPARAPDEYAIRFHLHPAVKANRLSDGHGVMLLLPDRERVDLQYLRGPGRDRGKRVSRRRRTARAAPCRS